MSKHGGEVNILNMKIIQEMSRSDKIKGPYDIIYSGGEASGCDHSCGVGMLPTQEMMAQAIANKIYDCAYLVPKHLLVVPETDGQVPTNHAIVNNMGGKPIPSCKLAIDTADFQGFRDRDPLYPDSAIMIKKLYEKEIKEKSNEVLQDLFQNTSKKKIIAVQHVNDYKPELPMILDTISREADATIVFFAAGTAPHHDSFDLYKKIASQMTEPSIVYESENVWNVVALISIADAVLSTSLHVRIMSFIHFKPRVTWCTWSKHIEFIERWDAKDSARCVNNYSNTWAELSKYYGPNPLINQEETKVVYERLVERYLEGFDKWSNHIMM
jgi:hypothetical protein